MRFDSINVLFDILTCVNKDLEWLLISRIDHGHCWRLYRVTYNCLHPLYLDSGG